MHFILRIGMAEKEETPFRPGNDLIRVRLRNDV